MSRKVFDLVYAREIPDHLRAIERKYHSLIRSAIEEQLSYHPTVETRNRKPLQKPSTEESRWELRFGSQNRFRALYQVFPKTREVHILAIGVKIRDRLFIGGEEIEL